MTREEAFLQEIREHPDDDSPRLVYADWLEEHGEPERAEFMRLQIELARMGRDDTRIKEVRKRVSALQQAHQDEWLRPLREALDRPRSKQVEDYSFERGLLHRLSLKPRRPGFMEAAAPFLRRHAVREVELAGTRALPADRVVDEVAACPELACLRELELPVNRTVSAEAVRGLESSPHLGRLTELLLQTDARGTRALLQSPLMPHLTHLVLTASRSPVEVAGLVAQAPQVAGLVALDVSGGIQDEGLRHLAESPHLRALEDLGLDNNHLSDEGVQPLLASPLMARLTRLSMILNEFGPQAVRALAASPHLAHLTWLSLAHNHNLGDAGAGFLAGSPHVAGLRRLRLAYTGLTGAGVTRLAGSPHWRDLEGLDLRGNHFGDVGAQALAQSPSLAGLRSLGLYGCRVGTKGARALAASPYLNRLDDLTLSAKAISKAAQQALRERFGEGAVLF